MNSSRKLPALMLFILPFIFSTIAAAQVPVPVTDDGTVS